VGYVIKKGYRKYSACSFNALVIGPRNVAIEDQMALREKIRTEIVQDITDVRSADTNFRFFGNSSQIQRKFPFTVSSVLFASFSLTSASGG
jgi:hypothetical protein